MTVPWLSLNGINAGVIADLSTTPKGARRDIGGVVQASDGTTRVTRQARKYDLSFSTVPLSSATAYAWENLVIGSGEVFSFDATLYGCKGSPPSAITNAARATSGPSPKFGAGQLAIGATTGTITYAGVLKNLAGVVSGWTIMVWTWQSSAWHHLVLRSDGAKWYDGSRADGTVTTNFSLSGSSVTLTTLSGAAVNLDDLVILPYAVPDDWPPAFSLATDAFSSLPNVAAAGKMIVEQPVRQVIGTCEDAAVIVATPATGGRQNDLRLLNIELMGV